MALNIKRLIFNVYDKMETLFYNIKYGISNIKKYRNVIWNDRDWDESYMYTLFEFKLKCMADSIEKNKNHIGYTVVVKDIRVCAQLIRELSDNTMTDNKMEKRFEFFHGKESFTIHPNDKYICVCNMPNTHLPSSAEYRRILNSIRKTHFDVLLMYIKNKSSSWWD